MQSLGSDVLMQSDGLDNGSDFNEWLRVHGKWSSSYEGDCHFVPQTVFVVPQHMELAELTRRYPSLLAFLASNSSTNTSTLSAEKRGCNLVLRFEHLQEEFVHLMKWAGMNAHLPTVRSSPRPVDLGVTDGTCSIWPVDAVPVYTSPAKLLLDDKVARTTQQRYPDDFKRFSYSSR